MDLEGFLSSENRFSVLEEPKTRVSKFQLRGTCFFFFFFNDSICQGLLIMLFRRNVREKILDDVILKLYRFAERSWIRNVYFFSDNSSQRGDTTL